MRSKFPDINQCKAMRATERGKGPRSATPVVVVSAFLTGLLALANAIRDYLQIFETATAITLGTSYVALACVLWNAHRIFKWPGSIKESRALLIAVLSCGFAAIVGGIYYPRIKQIILPEPAPPPSVQAYFNFIGQAFAGEPKGLKITDFYVDPRQSTYLERTTPLGRRAFEFNRMVQSAFRTGDCVGPEGSKYIERALPVLRRQLAIKKMRALAFTVGSVQAYRDTVRFGGDQLRQILPSYAEMRELEYQEPRSYRTIRDYYAFCIGLSDPVFTFVLTNTDPAKEQVVTEATYKILSAGAYRTNAPRLLEPIASEAHSLPFEVGTQVRKLSTPIVIPPGVTARVDIKLLLESPNHGLKRLVLGVAFGGRDYVSDYTKDFELQLSN